LLAAQISAPCLPVVTVKPMAAEAFCRMEVTLKAWMAAAQQYQKNEKSAPDKGVEIRSELP
jgi:hypothetical protein